MFNPSATQDVGGCEQTSCELDSIFLAHDMLGPMRRLLLLLSVFVLHADEGMWTFNKFPSEKVRAKYGFSPSQEWLDHVQRASVRLAEGCSASLVSPNGLVLTNHHCAASCIQQLSSAESDYSAKGYHAKSAAEELRC